MKISLTRGINDQMKSKLIVPLFVILSILSGCRSTPSNTDAEALSVPESADENQADDIEESAEPFSLPFPYMGTNSDSDFVLQSMLSGTVREITPDEFGTRRLVLEASQSYYLNGSEQTLEYDFIFGGLKDLQVSPGDSIETGQVLATATSDSYITARHKDLADFMIRMSEYRPVELDGFWYFSPSWIMPQVTRWLSFRQVPDFEAAVEDFYNRWAVEENEARGVTIHYFPNLDRIRGVVSFNDYPVVAERTEAVSIVEQAYYSNQHAFVLRNVLEGFQVDGHSVVLMWQKNFDQFLQEEYTPGEDIYLYCSIYVIDHENSEIVVFIRDFSFKDDESVIQSRKDAALE